MERGLRLFVAATVVLLVTAGIAIAAVSMHFNSPMDGAQEAPVPRDTQARGNAVYKLSADGTHIEYKVIVANIENVFMAHIHMGPPGVSGPIVVWLYPGTTPGVTAPLGGGRLNGVIVQGSFGASDFVGPLAGHPLSDLLELMRSGGVYTNVHTNDGDLVVNEGPGDFPAGEIRGQIKENGAS
jgi:hypothetical protein